MTLNEMKALPPLEQKALFQKLDKARYNAKGANYSSTYGAAPKTIARQAGMSEKEAKVLHKAYWKRNWSLKAIADACTTKIVSGQRWLYNPVSKLWYSLRADKDRFSTLNQGTGTYCFDMWTQEILKQPVKLNAQFHDEVILTKKVGNREYVTKYLKDCVGRVNKKLKLNRDLDVDVQYGESYAEIH